MLINVFNICAIENKTCINYGLKFICNVSKVLKFYVVICCFNHYSQLHQLEDKFLLPCHIFE